MKDKICVWSEQGQSLEKKKYSQYFIETDGGRSDAGFKGHTGDCSTRAISIVTGMSYKEVYKMINDFDKSKKTNKKKRSNARTGAYKDDIKKIMISLGFSWVPTMLFGQGCKVHLRGDELPKARILCNVSKHYVAVINGVIYDTYDPSRQGSRCVYGYFIKKND